jgi:LysR family transcriptional regulator, regulator for bpeEF and oprC
MDRLQAMEVFTRVVEVSSFTKAADILGLPRATVTNTIQALEAHLGARLLHRTTRRVNVTEDGAAYYERCVRILAEIEETESAFTHARLNPRGRLRVDMPGSIGKMFLLPNLAEFRERYPDIELMMGMSDRPIDLVQEGVDCVIRGGTLPDSNMIARRIGSMRMVQAASPDYLARYGEPASIEDLERHVCVNYFSSLTGKIMDIDFIVDGQSVSVPMASSVAVNDAEAYVTAGLMGLGIIQPPRFMVRELLAAGALREILTEARSEAIPISVMYPQNRHLSQKVRVFVDWVVELFGRCPELCV